MYQDAIFASWQSYYSLKRAISQFQRRLFGCPLSFLLALLLESHEIQKKKLSHRSIDIGLIWLSDIKLFAAPRPPVSLFITSL